MVPGWSDSVKEPHRVARECLLSWINGGRPKLGILFQNMCESRKAFKKAFNKCKANENNIRRSKMVKALKDKNTKEFWKNVRQIKDNLSHKTSKIDNETDPNKIVNIFSNKFKNIFDDKNSQTLQKFKTLNYEQKSLRFFSDKEIKNATYKLNPQIDHFNIHSNHLKYAPAELFDFLSKFLSACYRHAYLPPKMLSGILKPLVKDNYGDKEASCNFRPIITSSMILKTLEYVIKYKIEHLLETDENQFGFKSDASTHYAGLMLKEVVHYYKKRGSSVYAGYVDISKAFDKISHYKLMQTLKERGIDNGLLNLINDWYGNQEIKVNFGDSYSEPWYLRNGVRQGGVLSPYFFVAYIDQVIKKISQLDIGCSIRFIKVNSIVFADDYVLLAPSAWALQKMLNVLSMEFKKLCLNLNPSKCVYMYFKCKNDVKDAKIDIFIECAPLKRVSEYKYLGFIIDDKLSNRQDIVRARNKFNNTFFFLLRKFHYLDIKSWLHVFTAHCMHMYGAELWFSNKQCEGELKAFAISFHKALKIIVKVPYYFSNHHVCNSLDMLTFNHYLNWMNIRFTSRVFRSRNKLFVKLKDFLMKKSELANNVNVILSSYGIESLIENDIQAIYSRIKFVQAREEHSNILDCLSQQILCT
jgi:hypothetical protein